MDLVVYDRGNETPFGLATLHQTPRKINDTKILISMEGGWESALAVVRPIFPFAVMLFVSFVFRKYMPSPAGFKTGDEPKKDCPPSEQADIVEAWNVVIEDLKKHKTSYFIEIPQHGTIVSITLNQLAGIEWIVDAKHPSPPANSLVAETPNIREKIKSAVMFARYTGRREIYGGSPSK